MSSVGISTFEAATTLLLNLILALRLRFIENPALNVTCLCAQRLFVAFCIVRQKKRRKKSETDEIIKLHLEERKS